MKSTRMNIKSKSFSNIEYGHLSLQNYQDERDEKSSSKTYEIPKWRISNTQNANGNEIEHKHCNLQGVPYATQIKPRWVCLPIQQNYIKITIIMQSKNVEKHAITT